MNHQKKEKVAMTTKDFEVIAEIINAYRNSGCVSPEAADEVALAFSIGLRSTNPRFNPTLFLKACNKEANA